MLNLDKGPGGLRLRAFTVPKASSAAFAFAGDFTIEVFKAKFINLNDGIFVCNYDTGSPHSNQRSWIFDYSAGALRIVLSANGSTFTSITYPWSPSTTDEYDLAVDRSGSTVRLYVDGVKVANGVFAGALHQSTVPHLAIGCRIANGNPDSKSFIWPGSAKALRINGDEARYATDSSYSVPSLPLPTS